MFRGEGGLVVCKWGELGLGGRRRNRGGEGRQREGYINFFRLFPRLIIPSASPSTILTETSTRHRMDLQFQIPQ